MNKNTVIAGGLILVIGAAGYYFYKKMKSPSAAAPKPATISGALTAAGAGVATSELNNFTSWLTAPGANTGSTNSTSGTDAGTGYDDTGLDDLSGF